jgi:hypothetical protein
MTSDPICWYSTHQPLRYLLQCRRDVRVGSRAAVRPGGAEGPQHFQYPTTCCAAANRGFVPGTDIGVLFDQYVGAEQKRLGDGHAECLSGLQVDDESRICGCSTQWAPLNMAGLDGAGIYFLRGAY